MAEIPRDLGDFKGYVNLRLNFRLKGYVSHQYLWTVRWGNDYTATLLLKVFAQRNFVADFIRLKLYSVKYGQNCCYKRKPVEVGVFRRGGSL